MRTLYVFDIDGTLADCNHRLHLLKDKKYKEFYDACDKDKPIYPIISIARSLITSGKDVIFCTGRNERVLFKTKRWLLYYYLADNLQLGVNLFMRREGDKRSDTITKPELIQELAENYTDVIIFEDRDQMVSKWRELGYTCLQVCEGNY